MATPSTETTPLSLLDQIMPRVYTRVILCIPMLTSADPAEVRALLSRGLRKTVEQVPFLDGEVLPDTTSPKRQGRVATRVSQTNPVQLQTKDLTKKNSDGRERPGSYRDLAEENWPVEKFREVLSPVRMNPFPGQDGGSSIMAAQANFIEGGLLLCVAISHAVMDGIGVGTVLRLWAQHCRAIQGENLAEDVAAPAMEVPPEALDRTPLMSSGLSELSTQPHPEYVIATPLPSAPAAAPMESKLFYFSLDSLAKLKDAATKDFASQHEISTNDALSALLWSRITRARFIGSEEKLGEATVAQQQDKLFMANNGRRKLDPPLPDSYLGNVILYSRTVLPIDTLMSEVSLPDVARSVRASVNSINDPHIRSAIQIIENLPDVAQLRPGFGTVVGRDLTITSLSNLGLNGLDWGHGVGKVERVRVPYGQIDGLCIVLPRTLDGGLEVFVGLKKDTMDKLVLDEFFTRFAPVGR